MCKYDVEKTIKRINEKEIVFTRQKNRISKIGFVLWSENEKGEPFDTKARSNVFIPTNDFDLVLEVFKGVFPLENVKEQTIDEAFYSRGLNRFDKKTSEEIISELNKIPSEDEEVQQFLNQLINWFKEQLEFADYISVYGNL